MRNLPTHPCGEWGKPNPEKLLKAPLGDKLIKRQKKISAEPNQGQLPPLHGEKEGEICFGLDFSIPEALLSSPLILQFKAVSFQGDVLVMQSTGLELPGEGKEEKVGSPANPRIISGTILRHQGKIPAPSPAREHQGERKPVQEHFHAPANSLSCTRIEEKPQFEIK